jgi:L-talarate/galactarate dehydratase
VPIATGEHLCTIHDFSHLFRRRGTRIAIIDLARIGAITPWRHVASLAHAMNIPVCGQVIPEVSVHLLAAIPNGHLVEYVPRSEHILRDMPMLQDGALVAPDTPGLGLSIDQEALRRFTI